MSDPRSFAALLPIPGIAPELACVAAKFAALAPFARVAHLLSELLPIGGAANPGTVRNRTLRVGKTVAQLARGDAPELEPDEVTPAVIVALDGGYLRTRRPRPQRNFKIVAGKVIGSDGKHGFAFYRNGQSVEQFTCALVRAGVRGRTPVTALSEGNAGPPNLQRQALP